MQSSPQQPVMVRVIEQPVHQTSISDIIVGSFGLVGILLITAALLGLLLGGVLIAVKKLRQRFGHEPPPDRERLRVTPS